QGRAHLRADARSLRSDSARSAAAVRAQGQGGIPIAVHAAAWTANPRPRRSAARALGLRARSGARRASLLRLGGNVFSAATRHRRRTAHAQARDARGRRAGANRHREYWLTEPFAERYRNAGAPLDRDRRRGATEK